jgi:hypothetical protein
MKTTLISLLLLSNLFIYAQSNFPNTWKTGQTIKILGHDIKRDFGNARATPYIFYKTQEQLEIEAKELAKVNMWTADSLENHLEILKSFKGGQIGVKFVANNVISANTKNLRLIIQDLDGNEIHRQQLSDNIPDVSSIGGVVLCTSYDFVYFTFPLKTPFKVILINDLYKEEKYSKTIYTILN